MLAPLQRRRMDRDLVVAPETEQWIVDQCASVFLNHFLERRHYSLHTFFIVAGPEELKHGLIVLEPNGRLAALSMNACRIICLHLESSRFIFGRVGPFDKDEHAAYAPTTVLTNADKTVGTPPSWMT
ncbi:hypothetical protein CRV24_001722 [Beauveria bassiana]|nr:hypothetical protein CRV24_001722 [Beauveria bassiana]